MWVRRTIEVAYVFPLTCGGCLVLSASHTCLLAFLFFFCFPRPCSLLLQLTHTERIKITQVVNAKAGGRVKVVASGGLGCATIEEHADVVNEISQHCDAVVIVVNQMAKESESEEVWKANIQVRKNPIKPRAL